MNVARKLRQMNKRILDDRKMKDFKRDVAYKLQDRLKKMRTSDEPLSPDLLI